MRLVIESAIRENPNKRFEHLPKISIQIDGNSFREFKEIVINNLQKKCRELSLTFSGNIIQNLHNAYQILCDESIVFIKSFFEITECDKTSQLNDEKLQIMKYFIHLETLQKHNENILLQCRILTPEINLLITEDTDDICRGCEKVRAMKTCTGCHLERYCSSQCQRNHWQIHKQKCKKYSDKK